METWHDPIVEQVRAARAMYAESMQHNLAAICADLRRKQAETPERVVSFQPKPAPGTGRAD